MNQQTRWILREEFARTAVWVFFSIIGWSLIVTSTPELTPSLTVFGLLVGGSAVVMSGIVVAVRLTTGHELKGGTDSPDLLLVTSLFVVGFFLIWSSATGNWTTLTTILVAVAIGTVIVRVVRPSVFGIDSPGS